MRLTFVEMKLTANSWVIIQAGLSGKNYLNANKINNRCVESLGALRQTQPLMCFDWIVRIKSFGYLALYQDARKTNFKIDANYALNVTILMLQFI